MENFALLAINVYVDCAPRGRGLEATLNVMRKLGGLPEAPLLVRNVFKRLLFLFKVCSKACINIGMVGLFCICGRSLLHL